MIMIFLYFKHSYTDDTGVVSVNDPSVVMITESWLSTNIPDSAVMIGNNYNIFRLDRRTPGGGVLAYVNTCIPVERISNLEEEGKEVLWLVLKPPRTPRPFSSIIDRSSLHTTHLVNHVKGKMKSSSTSLMV